MKKTFKQFLIDAELSDLDIFKNKKEDRNDPLHDHMIKRQLKMEQLYDKHLRSDVERVLNIHHNQFKSFKEIWNGLARSQKDNTMGSFLHSLHDNYDFVRKLAEVSSIYNVLCRKTDNEFEDYIEEIEPAAKRMVQMYQLITEYRERNI